MIDKILSNDIYRKLIFSAMVLAIQAILRKLAINYTNKHSPEESTSIYSVRKIIRYVITFITLIFLYGIWIERLGDISIAMGVLAAGLAFALQEIIGSFAGWLTIISGKPFRIGDRIETGGIQGDVVDIGILRTTVMEIGNWLGGDHTTGRIVTLSNAFIFKEPLFSYSVHLNYIWDEISIPIPYDTDWKKAIEIMLTAVRTHSTYLKLLPEAKLQRQELRKRLAVRMTDLEPSTFVRLTDNWIELGLVYPVDTNLRRVFRSEVSQVILREFTAVGIDIASQTISIVDFPHVKDKK